MTSKTNLLPQVENGKKIAFWDLVILITVLSETNRFFVHTMVISWCQAGVKLAWKKSRPQSDQIDEEVTVIVRVHV